MASCSSWPSPWRSGPVPAVGAPGCPRSPRSRCRAPGAPWRPRGRRRAGAPAAVSAAGRPGGGGGLGRGGPVWSRRRRAAAIERLLRRAADRRARTATGAALRPGPARRLRPAGRVPGGRAAGGAARSPRSGAAVAGPLGRQLRTVAALLPAGRRTPAGVGATCRRSWRGSGRVLVRAGESGVRRRRRRCGRWPPTSGRAPGRTEAAVRRAGVWVLAPLGPVLPARVRLPRRRPAGARHRRRRLPVTQPSTGRGALHRSAAAPGPARSPVGRVGSGPGERARRGGA